MRIQFCQLPISSLDYNSIEKQDVIILNELDDIFRKHCKRLYDLCGEGRQSDCNPFRKRYGSKPEQFLSNFGAIQFILNRWKTDH
jgi:hypothetical protein